MSIPGIQHRFGLNLYARTREVGKFIEAGAENLFCALEARPAVLLAWLATAYFIGALISASRRSLWLDEIIAVHITGLPDLASIWSALLNATDGNPPLYYVLTRPFLNLLGTSELAVRLTAILGFGVAALCVFLFVRHLASATAAGIAALLFANSGAYYWATEARPYAVALCFAGIALVCWQRCGEESRRRRLYLIGLCASTACFVSTHYYSALIILPLLMGEATRSLSRKRVDWPVLVSLGVGVSALLLWLPILQSVRANVAGNMATRDYFARATVPHLYGAYAQLFDPWIFPGLLCISLVGVSSVGNRLNTRAQGRFPRPDLALMIGLSLLPVIAFLVAVLFTKTFVVRYVLAATVGMAGLLAVLIDHLTMQRRALAVGVLGILLGYFYLSSVLVPASLGAEVPVGEEMRFLKQANGKFPIVVTEGLLFVPMWYYAPSELKSRIFYITDLRFAERTTDTTNENIVLRLKTLAPGAIVDLAEFVTANKEFLVYYHGDSANSSLDALLARGCVSDLIRKDGKHLLFRCHCR